MKELKDFIVNVTRDAGELLADKFSQSHEIHYKGEIDLVTEADKMSEDLIISAIKKKFPKHGILSEESPAQNLQAEQRWIIDPLDGTTNYAHGYPIFCVSIALENEGVIVLGAIYDPLRNDMFFAERGKGAYLNGKKMKVSVTAKLSRSLLATGFPYDIRESKDNNIKQFNLMAMEAQAIRRAGAAALDIAYLACGRFDGFWELKLMPWDMAAACLMVEEAGGTVSNIAGGKWDIYSPDVLISNGLIHEQMINVLKTSSRMI